MNYEWLLPSGSDRDERVQDSIRERSSENFDRLSYESELGDPLVQFAIEYITSVQDASLREKGFDVPTVQKWTIALSKHEIPENQPNGTRKTYASLSEWAQDVRLAYGTRKQRKKATE